MMMLTPRGQRRSTYMMGEPVEGERPQDYRDLMLLMTTLQALDVREPERRADRDHVVAKLTYVARNPRMIRGGQDVSGGWAAHA